ncbi:MAG: hypothetical protein C0402_11575 [Thermodesulfovibrio sp.]|nr:hypothetical protein [Thermodesulfovibrio sp.]
MADKQPDICLLKFSISSRGVTDRILRDGAECSHPPDYSPVLYIAPTPGKLRDAQRRFHRLIVNPYIPPRFSTLKQLARSFFAAESRSRVFPDALVPLLISEISGHAIGYAGILSSILKEIKQHHPSGDLQAVRLELHAIYQRRGLPDDMLRGLDNTFEIFKQYQSSLTSAGYADEDDILIRGAAAVRNISSRFRVLLVDGFYDMTHAEMDLVGALIAKSDNVFITYPFIPGPDEGVHSPSGYLQRLCSAFEVKEVDLRKDEPTTGMPELSYIKYNSVEDEVEGIARHIKNLYIAGSIKPADSVVLTVPQLSHYRQLIERVLTRYGLPFTITTQKTFAQKGPLRDLLYLIETIADDFPRQKFTTFLNSPHFTGIPELLRQWIPSISLKSGIVKGREAWENLNPDIASKKVLAPLAEALKHIFSLLLPLISVRGGSTPENYHALIISVMHELGFTADDTLQRRLEDALEFLETLPELSGKQTVALARYAEFLRHMLNTPEYGDEGEGIQVMEFTETRGLEPDHLYFCGLKDGDMPSKPPVDHVLPDSVRREFGMIDLNTYLQTQKVYFLRVTGASSHRHLSYPSLEGDTVFLQSPYLPWGRESREKTYGILSLDELQTRKGFRPFEQHIREIKPGKKTVARILKKELAMPLRVTDIDAFRNCPRRFFIEKLLRLEASRISEYEIEARLLGTIFHKVMEELFRDPETEMSCSAMEQRAASIFDAVVKDYHLEPYWTLLLKESFIQVLPKILDMESEFREEGFLPFSLEMDIKKEEVLPGISLRGKIDRVDAGNKVFRIIDYKTGTADIGSAVIKSGKGLQLPLYAAMLKVKGMEVEKAGIYSLNTISMKWIPTCRDKYRMEEYIESALRYLEETVGEINTGTFRAHPLEDFFCVSCVEAPFCPYINLAPAGAPSIPEAAEPGNDAGNDADADSCADAGRN